MTEGGRNEVAELIQAAVYAGGYGALARELPEAARGLERMRDRHHDRVGALCGEVLAGAALRAAPHQ